MVPLRQKTFFPGGIRFSKPGSYISSVQLLSCVQLFVTPWTAAHQASLSFTISWSLLKLMSIKSVMPSNHLILCHPLLLLPAIFPSIRVFSNESVLRIRWPKYWNFSFSISPSNECSGLISFKIDWFVLLVVQGTLQSLLQHFNSKASILWSSAFFIVQLSHPYMTTGKNIALNIKTCVGKVMSLLFNMLFKLTIAFPYFKIRWKKVGKTTRPFRYDLNQIPYDYTVEVPNRFKGLDLIYRVPEDGWRFMTLYRRQ